MKTLIYIPIIHTSADLGSVAEAINKRGIKGMGETVWEEHKQVVNEYWEVISRYFDLIDADGMKIYQDGMVVEGEVGQTIVEESAKLGSKNYIIVSKLLKKGAVLVKTEDFKLVKEERDRIVAIVQAKSNNQKLAAALKYKLIKNKLLHERDAFIVKRIEETLKEGERGIIFIGAYHSVKEKLSKNIRIIEIKDTQKVSEYQKLLPFYHKNKERIKELENYLVSEIEPQINERNK